MLSCNISRSKHIQISDDKTEKLPKYGSVQPAMTGIIHVSV
jgi:hypothetical protein